MERLKQKTNLLLKSVMKPLIMAHRGGNCFATENSLEAIQQSLKHNPDIIEIDVRKSTDGVIFCYHGNIREFLFPDIYFKKPYSKIQKKYPTVVRLSEIASHVADKCILFVDIKDLSITGHELMDELKSLSKVYIASQNLNYLEKLPPIPLDWKKVCNGGILFLNNQNLSQLVNSNLNIIELFWWNFSNHQINLLRNNNIEAALAHWFLPQRIYLKHCFSKKSAWVWTNKFYKLVENKKIYLSDKESIVMK